MDENIIDEIDEQVIPTQRLTWRILLADFLNNVGGTLEQLAAFPHDIALRLEGDRKWREKHKGIYQDGQAEIDKLIREVECG